MNDIFDRDIIFATIGVVGWEWWVVSSFYGLWLDSLGYQPVSVCGISADGVVAIGVVCSGNERRGRFSWGFGSVEVRGKRGGMVVFFSKHFRFLRYI